jgi:peptidoglycan-associated lipoprotein
MRKLTIIVLVAIFISNIAIAQKTSVTAGADTLYKYESYAQAIQMYKGILKKKNVSGDIKSYVYFQLGECYRKTGKFNDASLNYQSSMALGNNTPEVNLYIGDMLLRSGQYDQAIGFMEKRLNDDPNDSYAMLIKDCAEYAKKNEGKLSDFEVTNQVTMNTAGAEYGVYFFPIETPVLYANDKGNIKYSNQFDLKYAVTYDFIYWLETPVTPKTRLAYSSTGLGSSQKIDKVTGMSYTDIYEVLYDNRTKKWGKPDVLQGLNTNYHDAFFTYNKKEKLAYFTQCNGLKFERKTCNTNVSAYNENNNTWQDPVLFEYNSDVYDCRQPSISEDGNTLFFVSNMPGGQGGQDIWMVKRENGIWGQPVNLGPKINTPWLDGYPFIFGDSLLYFASTGHMCFGGLDIFKSKIDAQGNFSEPVNVGAPINSSADDFGITLKDTRTGWYSSNRVDENNKDASDDIYAFKGIKKLYNIEGNVRTYSQSKVVSKLKVLCTGDDGSKETTLSDDNGDFIFRDKDPEVKYSFIVTDPDYLTNLKSFKYFEDSLDNNDIAVKVNPKVDIEVLKTPKTKEYEIKNIYWDFNKWDLRPESKNELDKIIENLKETKQYIVINAYTDAIGSDDYNLILSYKRANSVVNYLIYKGVSKDKLAPIGHGENDLVIKNATTEDDHQKNRRTTFQLLKKYEDFATYYNFSKSSGIDKIDLTKNFDLVNNNLVNNGNNFIADGNLNTKFRDGVEFRVQFIATRNPVNSNYYNKIRGNTSEQINYSVEGDGFHRYSVGSYTDIKAAVEMQQKLQKLGYNDAFVVAYNKGKKITIK